MAHQQTSDDTKYLFKRDKTWWVKLAVPKPLRGELGYDLRRSLHTDDIEAARKARWEAIDEFRKKFEEVRAQQGGASAAAVMDPTDSTDETQQAQGGVRQVDQHIVEIVSDSGEGAQKCGQVLGLVSGKMGNGVWTVEIIPAEIQPPARERQGASGIRVRMGSKYMTNMGDEADIVVAFNEQVLYSRISNHAYRKGTVVLLENMWAEDPDPKIREQYKEALADFEAQGLVVIELPIQKECLKLVPDPRKGKNMFGSAAFIAAMSTSRKPKSRKYSRRRARRSSRSTMTCSMPVIGLHAKTSNTRTKYPRLLTIALNRQWS
jgi:Pyruvate/2-oxoacid:ferredoxin oxidoreductase gamma subunit